MSCELLGYRVGVTSHRRSDELVAALERHGAEVLAAPALRVGPVADDAQLLADTRRILAQRPDVVVVTTAYGIRRWREAAAAHGLADELTSVLRRARLLCRGGKARGELVAGDLPHAEALGGLTSQVVDELLARGVAGSRVAVQLHGLGDEESVRRLAEAGAEVGTVVPYRWLSADDGERLPHLIRQVAERQVHLVTFTVAASVDALLSTAAELGLAEPVREAFATGQVVPCAVGPVTAQPLLELGAHPVVPERFKLGALAKEVCRHAEREMSLDVATAAGDLSVRGLGYLLQGQLVQLPQPATRVLRQLVRQAGEPLSVPQLATSTALDDAEVAAALDQLGHHLPSSVVQHTATAARLVPSATLLQQG